MAKIENERQYEAMMARIDELLEIVDDNTPVEDRNSIELDLLSSLVAEYEKVHYPVKKPTLVDILKLRMYEITKSLPPSTVSRYIGCTTKAHSGLSTDYTYESQRNQQAR